MGDNKKFRDTKVGKFINQKAPKVIDIVGDALPDSGVLGIVKNLIDKDDKIAPAEKAEILSKMQEIFKAEFEDRDSARTRQVEMAKTDKTDIMFNITGFIGLAAFCFIIYAIVFLKIPDQNKEVWIHLIGICEGIVMSIFGYFYGSAVRKNIQ